MSLCSLCGGPINSDDETNYKEVSGYVHGPKSDGMTLRTATGNVAHEYCVKKVEAGQAADQPELFDDKEEQVRSLARWLQSEGPDEYPYGYYEHLARKRLNDNQD